MSWPDLPGPLAPGGFQRICLDRLIATHLSFSPSRGIFRLDPVGIVRGGSLRPLPGCLWSIKCKCVQFPSGFSCFPWARSSDAVLSSGTQVATVKPSPVGGAMVRLPHDAGLVAIKTEAADPSRAGENEAAGDEDRRRLFRERRFNPHDSAPDRSCFRARKSPLETADFKTVTLEADPAIPNRFVSAASSFPGGVEGKIRMKIDGQDLEESFSAR